MAVVLPFESPNAASLNRLVELVAADMERVNATILARTGSEVAMIPEVANHLIASGGKRLRPMLTLAMARLAGYSGDGHIKLAAAVEFMHTATLLRRRCGRKQHVARQSRRPDAVGNERACSWVIFSWPGIQDDGRSR